MLLSWFLQEFKQKNLLTDSQTRHQTAQNQSHQRPKNRHVIAPTTCTPATPASEKENAIEVTYSRTPLAYCWYIFVTERSMEPSSKAHFLDLDFVLSNYTSNNQYVNLSEDERIIGEGDERKT